MTESHESERKPAGLEYLLKNLAVLTAFITLVVGACATAVLYGYVTAFDPDNPYVLFTFMQYTDILQFALGYLGLSGFVLFLVFGLFGAELSRRFRHPFSRITLRTIVAVVIMVLFIWAIPSADRAGLIVGVSLITIIVAAAIALGSKALKLSWLSLFGGLGFLGFALIGANIGTRERTQNAYSVTLQDGKLENVRLMLTLSRGYLFFDPADKHVFLIPEKEIRRIDHKRVPK
jgi:hypothetical protein